MQLEMSSNSTICAISTAPGMGAIAVIRMSGEQAIAIADSLTKTLNLQAVESHTAHFCRLESQGIFIDEVVATVFKAPKTYTGEDLVEISCHGSTYIQKAIVEALIDAGATYAEPGEFTQRAFLNGKLDLSQAEAVADLISSDSPASHELALKQMRGGFSGKIKDLRERLIHFASMIELELDFSEEDVEFASRDELRGLILDLQGTLAELIQSFRLGNALKKGIPVAIVGRPNAGKSTLLNTLLKEDRAIVSDIAGTTRDVIEDTLVINGITYRFIDTAGLREGGDVIEEEGIQRTRQKITEARIVFMVIDVHDLGDETLQSEVEVIASALSKDQHLKLIVNKIDEANPQIPEWMANSDPFQISARDQQNTNAIETYLSQFVNQGVSDDIIVTNARHVQEFEQTNAALDRVIHGMDTGISSDLIAMDIRQAVHHLGLITGEISTDDLLDNIFSNFCIGK